MNGTELVTLLLVAVVVGTGYSQFCTMPTEESLERDLEQNVIPLSSFCTTYNRCVSCENCLSHIF